MTCVQRRQDWIKGRRERRKLTRYARLRRQVLRYFFLCLLAGCGVSCFVYLPWCLSDIDRDIVVHGNQVVSPEQVRGVLANSLGKPLYRLNPQRMATQVQSLEAVRHAFVRRYLFPRPQLVVHVLEEFPWASLSCGPGYPPDHVISETGRVIPIKDFPLIAQPKFVVYGSPQLKLTGAQVGQWASWVSFIANQTGQPVEYVDMRNGQDIAVKDGALCLRIGAPDSTLTRRLGRLASVMPVIGQFRDCLEYIDLGLDNNIPLKLTRKNGELDKQDTLLLNNEI
ncbi:MAG: FtsQ-type POTRA domain-containing protein [Candidatus Melainabacteria bacterium]|nr:FtsQ-type POTRA domain-containing protein [Candidatus Melainabacteria bacterium]